MKSSKLNIREVDIKRLRCWDKNPRDIHKDDFDRLKNQIKRLGVYKPLVAVSQNGRYVVLGGNMRLKALQDLGFKKVEVSVVKAPTEKKRIEYALSDNDRAGFYVGDQLEDLIRPYQDDLDLSEFKVDLDMKAMDLNAVLDQYNQKEPEENFDLKESLNKIKKPKSKRGQIYQLGSHRLMCGDATSKEDVKKLMDGKKADMVFTDPPYRLSGKGFGYKGDKQYGKLKSNKIFDYESWLRNVEVVAKKNFNILVFEFWKNVTALWHALEKYYQIKNVIIWNATTRYAFPHKFFSSRYDICVYGVKGNYCFNLPRNKGSNPPYDLIASPPESEESAVQSIVFGTKPICILVPYINPLCPPSGIILDLFGGSGSTLIACEQTDRICHMMEIEPIYCDVIRERYKKYAKEKEI